MWRLFKHYNISTAYDGFGTTLANPENANLDECKVAGQINILALLEIIRKREWKWAAHVRALSDLSMFESLMNCVPVSRDEVTPKKWKNHLRDMVGFGILKRKARTTIKAFARYFAVMKSDGVTARSIFNGKKISQAFVAPPTTNLPDIEDVLRLISESDYLIIGDYRHYFHQFALHEDVSSYFGLQQGEETYIYKVLPMGWSWSPRIAQCSSMTIIIEAGARAGLLDAAVYKHLENPPSIVMMKGGASTVWYDNVIGMFTDAQCRDAFYQKLIEICSEKQLNVAWKNIQKYSRKDMPESNEKRAAEATTTEERSKFALPTYLGLVFANASSVRSRHDDATSKIKWKHDPARLERWRDLTCASSFSTLRSIARVVGCILWDAVISCRPLCNESRSLRILSAAGKAVSKNNWDEPITSSDITSDDVEYLRMRMDVIVNINPYHTMKKFIGNETIECASDACGTGTTSNGNIAKSAGYGYVVWADGVVDVLRSCLSQQSFPEPLSGAHIYILEMYAALMCVSKVATNYPGCTIRLAEDNTAVLGSLKNGYAHNHVANEMIQRIFLLLETRRCRLEMIPVPSKSNAADAPSRGLPYNLFVDQDCRRIMAMYTRLGRVEKLERLGPEFTGNLRHDEPPDNVWTTESLNLASLFDDNEDVEAKNVEMQ